MMGARAALLRAPQRVRPVPVVRALRRFDYARAGCQGWDMGRSLRSARSPSAPRGKGTARCDPVYLSWGTGVPLADVGALVVGGAIARLGQAGHDSARSGGLSRARTADRSGTHALLDGAREVVAGFGVEGQSDSFVDPNLAREPGRMTPEGIRNPGLQGRTTLKAGLLRACGDYTLRYPLVRARCRSACACANAQRLDGAPSVGARLVDRRRGVRHTAHVHAERARKRGKTDLRGFLRR
jgi:hypothetical protein